LGSWRAGNVGIGVSLYRLLRRKCDAVVVQTHAVSKCYSHILAIDSVDLRVEHGEIYGFLGRNGAGKTTTIRALLGMIHPSKGMVSVFGERIGPGGRGPWRRVGHLVETPAAYPELTV
jgi:ABC-2 type transport system ATP-binding protein